MSSCAVTLPPDKLNVSRDADRIATIVTACCHDMANGASFKQAAEHQSISTSSLWKYIASDPAHRQLYRDTRVLQSRAWADDTINLADEASPEDQAKVRLQIQARQWLASKHNPQEYGDKIQVESTTTDTGSGEARLAALMAALPAALSLLPPEQRQALAANLQRLAPTTESAEIIQDSPASE